MTAVHRQFNFKFAAALLLTLAVLPINLPAIERGQLWRDASVTQLDVDFGGTGFHARWRYHRCACGDLAVEVEQIAPDGILTGELLMVDGQALLARNFDQQSPDIEPLIQAPSLMLQLAFELLNRARPKGPFAEGETQNWETPENKQVFRIDTGLATGAFGAPWKVRGSSWKTAAGRIRVDFRFQFNLAAPGEPVMTDYIGFSWELDYSERDFKFSGPTPLDGWRLQWISRNETESSPVSGGLSLDDLRQQARHLRENSDSVSD
jgi:hypothetical protein